MRSYLVFDIYAPMASWGNENRGQDNSWGQSVPTKSAIIGMLGACMGIDFSERHELTRLSDTLRMGVLTLCEGTRVVDLRTIRTGPISGTGRVMTRTQELERTRNVRNILGRLLYYSGQLHTVILHGETQELARAAAALDAPFYTPCAGRKSCLFGRPFNPVIVEAERPEDVLIERGRLLKEDEALAHLIIPDMSIFTFEDGMGATPKGTLSFCRDAIAPTRGHLERAVFTSMLRLEN